jgi:hypothetical protein
MKTFQVEIKTKANYNRMAGGYNTKTGGEFTSLRTGKTLEVHQIGVHLLEEGVQKLLSSAQYTQFSKAYEKVIVDLTAEQMESILNASNSTHDLYRQEFLKMQKKYSRR